MAVSSLKRKAWSIGSLILLLAMRSAQAQEVRYVYDELGRLIAVMDEQGRTAIYEYDEVGNILAIRRVDATGPVAITFFNPNEGPIGTRVEIFGIGFSATPTQNTIAFNGVSAPVLAASLTSLTTEVPNGATTGPITVTSPLGSATSPEPFTVVSPVTINPTEAMVFPGFQVQFTANVPVTWRVNEIPGGNATFGTIMSDGIYTAPAVVPGIPNVTISAVHQQDPRLFAEASVTILVNPERLLAKPVSIGFPPPPNVVTPVLGPLVSVTLAPPPPAPALVVGPLVSLGLEAPLTTIDSLTAHLISLATAPLITSITPSSGIQGATDLGVTLGGAGFTGATAVQFLRNGSPDANITVSNLSVSAGGTQATVTISINAAAALGVRTVTITTPDGTSTPQGIGGNIFNVTAP